jgi:hypothetical protein
MNRQTAIAIAFAAGMAGGLMSLAGLRPTAFSLPLLIVAPAAIYIASLGWGTVAGIIAAATATGIGFIWHGPAAIAVTGALLFAPAALAGHLANLAQPNPNGQGLLWYPLSDMLFRLMMALFVGFVIAGIAIGYERQEIAGAFSEFFREIMAADGAQPPSDEAIRQTAEAYAAMLPGVISGILLLAHVLVMHFSAVITARSGLLARPPEDLAANISLPKSALAIPGAGLFGIFFLGSPAFEIASLAAGLGIAGFALVGLGELHVSTRGRPARSAILFFSYLLLVVFGFPVFVLAVMGALRTLKGPAQNSLPPGSNGNGRSLPKP